MKSLREAAGPYVREGLDVILELMRTASSDAVRLAAAREILDRAIGRPGGESTGIGGKSLEQLLEEAGREAA